jgi:hypothetical protein
MSKQIIVRRPPKGKRWMIYVGSISGSGGASPDLPTAPVLALDPSWLTTDDTPDFVIDIDASIVAGDDVRLVVQVAGGDWSSPVSDTTQTITAPEDAADQIDLAIGAQANGNYEARAYVIVDAVSSAASNTVSFTIAAFSGVGDIHANGFAYYSPARAYNAAYALAGSPAVDLVDQAGANLVTINMLPSGLIDLASIAAWVTANSVSTIKVNRLYDQTGNGRHLTNGTLSQMATLVLNSLNGLPGLSFVTASATQYVGSNLTQAQPITFASVYKRTAVNNAGIIGSNSAPVGLTGGSVSNTASVSGGTVLSVASTDSTFHAAQAILNGASSYISVDGTSATGAGGATGYSASAISVGRANGSSTTSIIMEAMIWAGANSLNSTQCDDINSNQHGASGYNF